VTDGNRVTRVIGRDVSLTATDVITLEGTRDEGELARFDLIRFTPKGTNSPDPGNPPDGEDTTPPTATQLTDQLTSTAGSDEPVGIAIRYDDAGGIDLSSLDVADITVSNGQTTLAVERFVVSPDDQTVTYFVKPPSQGWQVGDSDDYVVELVANEVADEAGNLAAAKTLGSFELTVTPETDPGPGPSTPLGSRSVTMGGGGFVTDVHLHPAEKDLAYIRTDMGGFYRWETGDGGHWVPLTESFPQALEQYYGGEALAFDPSNPDVVYIAAGKKLNSSQPGTILKSTDRGETWTKLDIDLRMGGNDVDRWIGERMAVDPNDSQTVLFGSRKDGLWQTTNGGEDWRKVSSLPNPGNNTGIAGILFDPNQAGLVYANSYGNGVYRSTNGGDSWSKISGSSSRVQRMSIAPDGTLYAATENHPKVTKYDPKANRWSDITPDGAWSGAKFGTISVNPHEPNELIASTGETSSPQIFFSKNGGDSWQQIKPKLNNTVPWWDDFMLRLPWISDIEFDPHVPDRVWMTNWYGTWRTDDVDDFSEPWTNFTKGHEQTVPFDMISPPDGPLLVSAMADVDGFYHDDFDTSPSRRLGSVEGTTRFSDSYSIDYAQSQPNRMARVGGNSGKQKYGLAISNDSGRTWHESDAFPSNVQPVELAFSATDPDTIVVVRKDATALYTNNGGDSWKSVKGLPTDLEGRFNWNKPLTADANGNFYYYSSGKLYRSTNDGASFSVVETNLPYDWPYKLKSPQGEANEVWLSAEDRGLYRSTNGGSDFSRISNVEKATMFSFGVPESANDFPYIYLYGVVTGQGESTYVSKDEGKTWQDIGSPDAVIGNRPVVMEGSWQTPGLVFVGANGRGIYVGNA
ncbi:MAG: YCF48-related protein, partial [Cyanobacteria bacterium J06607_6]